MSVRPLQEYSFCRRGIYVVVFRVTEGVEAIHSLTSYLLSIQSRAPNACVVLVGSHADQVRYYLINNLLFPSAFNDKCNYEHVYDIHNFSYLPTVFTLLYCLIWKHPSNIDSWVEKRTITDYRGLLISSSCRWRRSEFQIRSPFHMCREQYLWEAFLCTKLLNISRHLILSMWLGNDTFHGLRKMSTKSRIQSTNRFTQTRYSHGPLVCNEGGWRKSDGQRRDTFSEHPPLVPLLI